MIIHKTHSKNDLTDLINTLNLKIVFSHVDIKRDIHDKLIEFLNQKNNDKINYPNVYKIKNKNDLKCYLKSWATSLKINEPIMSKFIFQIVKNYLPHKVVIEATEPPQNIKLKGVWELDQLRDLQLKKYSNQRSYISLKPRYPKKTSEYKLYFLRSL